MKKRVKVKMEKEVKEKSSNNSRASLTPEQANLTKPERKSMKLVFKQFSFAPNLLDLANQAAAKAETEGEQAESQMIQQRALKEAKFSRGLEMYKSYKNRVKESGLGVCKKRFVENRLCETLKPLSWYDLLVLANAASVEFAPQVSRANVSKEAAQEPLLARVEEDTCKQREAEDLDRGGSCFGLPEKPQRNRELVQQRGSIATLVKVVKEDTPDRCLSDGHREEKLFEKKYVRRRKRVKQEQLEWASVEAVAGTSNGVKKLCKHKPSRLIYVDDAQRVDGYYDSGQTRSEAAQVEAVKGQGHCTGTNAQTANKTQIGVENQQITRKSSLIPSILEIKNQEIPKRKRSKRKREPKEQKRNMGKRREAEEHACDQIDSDATETKEDYDAGESKDEEEENTISKGDSGTEVEEDNDAGKQDEENTICKADSETEAETDNDVDKRQEEEEENTIYETEADEDSDTEKPKEDDEEENTISKVASSRAALGSETVDEGVIVSDSEEVSEASICNWLSFRTRPRSCNGMRNVQWSIKKKRNRMTLHETQSNRKILLLALETITLQFGLLKLRKEKKSS